MLLLLKKFLLGWQLNFILLSNLNTKNTHIILFLEKGQIQPDILIKFILMKNVYVPENNIETVYVLRKRSSLLLLNINSRFHSKRYTMDYFYFIWNNGITNKFLVIKVIKRRRAFVFFKTTFSRIRIRIKSRIPGWAWDNLFNLTL